MFIYTQTSDNVDNHLLEGNLNAVMLNSRLARIYVDSSGSLVVAFVLPTPRLLAYT